MTEPKTELDWTPPAGMLPTVAASWRAFYLKAQNGSKGYTATPAMYVILYKVQLGRCFICRKAKGINPEDPKGRGPQRLGWDHNHATGMVRGLLCTKGQWSCNRIVGRYKDDPDAFMRGYRYLMQPPATVLSIVQHKAAGIPVEDRIKMAAEVLNEGTVSLALKVAQGLPGTGERVQ